MRPRRLASAPLSYGSHPPPPHGSHSPPPSPDCGNGAKRCEQKKKKKKQRGGGTGDSSPSLLFFPHSRNSRHTPLSERLEQTNCVSTKSYLVLCEYSLTSEINYVLSKFVTKHSVNTLQNRGFKNSQLISLPTLIKGMALKWKMSGYTVM